MRTKGTSVVGTREGRGTAVAVWRTCVSARGRHEVLELRGRGALDLFRVLHGPDELDERGGGEYVELVVHHDAVGVVGQRQDMRSLKRAEVEQHPSRSRIVSRAAERRRRGGEDEEQSREEENEEEEAERRMTGAEH